MTRKVGMGTPRRLLFQMNQLRCVHRAKLTVKEAKTLLVSQIHSSEFDAASASAGRVRNATVARNGIKWFQIVAFFCVSILLERLIIAMLGHVFGRNRSKA